MNRVMIEAICALIIDAIYSLSFDDVRYVRQIGVVAMLHVVDDSKYDTDSQLGVKLTEFVKTTFPPSAKQILDIIHRISYSKEKAHHLDNTYDEWLDEIGETGRVIRKYVINADRQESVGIDGWNRSWIYNMNRLRKQFQREATAK